MSLLNLSCKEASRLVSKSQEVELGRGERFALSLHTLLCFSCRRFSAQLKLLRNVFSLAPEPIRVQWFDHFARLSEHRKNRIKELLAEIRSKEK